MQKYKNKFIELAIKSQALKFGEFILKSGRVSPYFFNAGLLSTGEAMEIVSDCYVECIIDQGLKFDIVFGPAYKGIPLSAVIAMKLYSRYGVNVGYAYNRKEAKDHGEGGVLVGANLTGKRVLIVDDVITAGTAILESVSLLKATNASIVGVSLALDRQEKGQKSNRSAIQEISEEYGFSISTIINVSDILGYLKGQGGFKEYISSFNNYRARYGIQGAD